MDDVRSEVRDVGRSPKVPSGRLGFISVPRIGSCLAQVPWGVIEDLANVYLAYKEKDSMSGKYAFTKSLKEVRFLFCQTSEHSAATRFVAPAFALCDLLN